MNLKKIVLLYLCIIVLGLSQSLSLSALSLDDNRYDKDIKKYVKMYWIDYPVPEVYKAQLYQESRLKSTAVSPVGASGIAQFMPKTWVQIARELNYDKYITPYDTKFAIEAGAYYMKKLRKAWNWKRPQIDKHKLALASYNAGIGNLLKAQELCNNAILYKDIIKCLPQVTGKYSEETIMYNIYIYKYYKRIILKVPLEFKEPIKEKKIVEKVITIDETDINSTDSTDSTLILTETYFKLIKTLKEYIYLD